ncbi:MAG: hypothetical protein AAGA25_12725, partial [Planctomycetota bacterium]
MKNIHRVEYADYEAQLWAGYPPDIDALIHLDMSGPPNLPPPASYIRDQNSDALLAWRVTALARHYLGHRIGPKTSVEVPLETIVLKPSEGDHAQFSSVYRGEDD